MIKPATTVFSKSLRIKHLDWSSLNKEAHIYDYIRDYVARELCDRIEDLNGVKNSVLLNIGSCSGLVAKYINAQKVDAFIQADISLGALQRCRELSESAELVHKFPFQFVELDEERLPLRAKSVDLAVSCLNFHWVNDLVKSFKRVRRVLRPNSPFIGTIFGGDTLYEMRSSMQLADQERLGTVNAHVAPKTTGQDVGRLLQAAGFHLITVDVSDVKIRYPSAFELMFDLRGMGEDNATLGACQHLDRNVLQATAAIYQSLYGTENIEDGVPATFQVIHFIGWKEPTKATKLQSSPTGTGVDLPSGNQN